MLLFWTNGGAGMRQECGRNAGKRPTFCFRRLQELQALAVRCLLCGSTLGRAIGRYAVIGMVEGDGVVGRLTDSCGYT